MVMGTYGYAAPEYIATGIIQCTSLFHMWELFGIYGWFEGCAVDGGHIQALFFHIIVLIYGYDFDDFLFVKYL